MKKIFIFGGIIALIGLVIIMISTFFGGFESLGNMDDSYEERVMVEYVFEGSYDEIIVVDKNIPMYISQSEDDKIYITTYESSNYFYDIVDNNKLEIRYVDNTSKSFRMINFNLFTYSNYYTEIKLPANISCSIDISNKNGRMEFDNIIVDKNINVESSNGSMYINQVQAEEFELKTSNGRIELDNIEANNIKVETTNGDIDVNNITSYDDLSLKTSNGDISGRNIKSISDIYVKTSNGKVDIEDLYYQEKAEIKSSNGSIFLEIDGKLDDYTIYAETSNSKIFINDDIYDKKFVEGDGAKVLNVKSSNSKINIGFMN